MRTRLHGWHLDHGARMVDFGGWEMPVQYEAGPREEHRRVREAAGLFDIDHMGRVEITGPGAVDFLQRVQTWNVAELAPGRAHYSLLLNDAGGIIDDIFIYRRRPREGGDDPSWLLVINAANAAKDLAWLQDHASAAAVSLRDLHETTCLMALQGPKARSVLQALVPGEDLGRIAYHRVVDLEAAGISVTACTTGYTGERGFELLAPAADGLRLWEAILQAGAGDGVLPCGLAARDSLRAEACFPLYGNEIDESTNPLSAGLMRAAVRLEGHDFIGRRALAALALVPLEDLLVGFEMTEPGVPRHGYAIARDAEIIGKVTTGLFSPSTGRYVGMGYVAAQSAAEGTEISVRIREVPKAARIVERPFYRSPYWR